VKAGGEAVVSDPTTRRADTLLTELVELVETARAVPMSGSCVVPREHMLDLLDGLRELLPPELAEARRIVADRDGVLTGAREEAERIRAAADEHARGLLGAAEAEHERLVSQTAVHVAAREAAAGIRRETATEVDAIRTAAEEDADRMRGAASSDADRMRGAASSDADAILAEAHTQADSLRRDAEEWTQRILAGLVETLNQTIGVAERGRAAIAEGSGRGPIEG
jgi:cell division septum initiation protein DivIVA